jgi:hypothetical protein
VLEKKGTIEKKAMRLCWLKPEKKLFCQQAGAYTPTLLTAFYSPVLYYLIAPPLAIPSFLLY